MLRSEGLAGSHAVLASSHGLAELGGTAEGDVSEVTTDGSDGLGGVGSLNTGGLLGPHLAGLVVGGAILSVDLDFVVLLNTDDGGLSLDVTSVALGGLAGVIEGVVGHTDGAALLEELVGAAGEEPSEISGAGGHDYILGRYKYIYFVF